MNTRLTTTPLYNVEPMKGIPARAAITTALLGFASIAAALAL